jgi:hypothetical protein
MIAIHYPIIIRSTEEKAEDISRKGTEWEENGGKGERATSLTFISNG